MENEGNDILLALSPLFCALLLVIITKTVNKLHERMCAHVDVIDENEKSAIMAIVICGLSFGMCILSRAQHNLFFLNCSASIFSVLSFYISFNDLLMGKIKLSQEGEKACEFIKKNKAYSSVYAGVLILCFVLFCFPNDILIKMLFAVWGGVIVAILIAYWLPTKKRSNKSKISEDGRMNKGYSRIKNRIQKREYCHYYCCSYYNNLDK